MCLCDCVSIAALFDCLARDLRCFAGYFTENKIQIYKGFVELDFLHMVSLAIYEYLMRED